MAHRHSKHFCDKVENSDLHIKLQKETPDHLSGASSFSGLGLSLFGFGGVFSIRRRISSPSFSFSGEVMGPKTIHFDKEMPTAIGRALMSWQIVENEIYKLIHAVLNVDPLYSSAIYFEIKSPNHKISLADKLLKLHLDRAEYARFKPLL